MVTKLVFEKYALIYLRQVIYLSRPINGRRQGNELDQQGI